MIIGAAGVAKAPSRSSCGRFVGARGVNVLQSRDRPFVVQVVVVRGRRANHWWLRTATNACARSNFLIWQRIRDDVIAELRSKRTMATRHHDNKLPTARGRAIRHRRCLTTSG